MFLAAQNNDPSTRNEHKNTRESRGVLYRDILSEYDDFNPDSIETIQVSQEAPWDVAGESLLRKWMETAGKQASSHQKTGYKLKKLYKIFGISAVFSAALVFLMSNLQFGDQTRTTVVHSIASFINLLIANLAAFLSYGPKYQLHFEFEGKFTKVYVDIEELLAIDREFRSPKDRVLAEYKEKMGNLFTHAPET